MILRTGLKQLFILLTMSTLSLAAIAEEQGEPNKAPVGCVSQAEMKTIASHFKQFSQFANADYCYDGSQNSNLIASIMFMRKTAYNDQMAPSQDDLFTGRFAKSWYDYFIGRIDNLEIVSSCQKGVVAYVYMFGGKTMYACPLALTDTFSSLDRASVFMHEARHIDGFPHITCSKGPRQGIQGACDTRISDGGSYAVTVETYAQLAKYATDLHPALRAYARSSAVVYADEAFENQVRINRTENLVVLTSSLDFQSINLQNGQVTALGKAPAAGHIIHRAQHLVLFPEDKNLNAQYVFTRNEGTISQSPGDLFTEYNEQTPAEKANLVDFHSSAQWSARVYKNSIRFLCDPKSAATQDVALPAGLTAANLIYPNGYDRNAASVNLVNSQGGIYEIGCSSRKAYLKEASIKFDQNFKRLYKIGAQTVGLNAQGQLFRVDGGKSVPLSTAFDGQIIEIVPQQTFQFFETN